MREKIFIIVVMAFAYGFICNNGMKRKDPFDKNVVQKKVKFDVKELFRAIQDGDVNFLQAFLKSGGDVNIKMDGDWRPLHIAAVNGRDKLVSILLKNGAIVDVKEFGGKTPLHFAVQNGHDKVVTVLLKNGADVNATTKRDITPLHFAVKSGHDRVVRVLLEYGAQVNAKMDGDWTPLHVAAENGHDKVVLILLENGADVNAKGDGDWTPLHEAAESGHDKVVLILLENGADFNAKSCDYETPLDLGVLAQHNKVITILKLFSAPQQTEVNNLLQEADQSNNKQALLFDYFKAAYLLVHSKMIDELYDRMKQNNQLAQHITTFLLGNNAPTLSSHKSLRSALANKALKSGEVRLAAKYLDQGYPYDSELAKNIYNTVRRDADRPENLSYMKAYSKRQSEEKMLATKPFK